MNNKRKHEADLRKNIDEHELSLYNKFIYAYNHFTRKGMVIYDKSMTGFGRCEVTEGNRKIYG